VRKGLTPWFEPPAPGAPMRYHGWVWDPGLREWVAAPVARIVAVIQQPKFPKPQVTPRPAQPFYVVGWWWNARAEEWEEIPLTPEEISEGRRRGRKPQWPPGPEVLAQQPGWSWSYENRQWVATIVFGTPVNFEPPRPFRPDISFAGITVLTPIEREWTHFLTSLINAGLNPTEARRVADGMRKHFWELSKARRQIAHTDVWRNYMQANATGLNESLNRMGAVAVVIAMTAAIGYLIGTIAERLAFGRDEHVTLVEKQRTYLIGPDYWKYSRMIGRTRLGVPYYSECEEIGTTYVRLKRGYGAGDIDIIDFLGGFLETGYVFPYFYKYRWFYWTLSYVGMLSHQGAGLYSLRKGNRDRGGVQFGRMLPSTSWCTDFHWYL